MLPRSPLIGLLAHPNRIADFHDKDWDLVIRQGRAAGMLATVHRLLKDRGLLDQVPKHPLIHLGAAERIATRHREVTLGEVRELYRLMERIGVPMIVLKGAAYVAADLDAARGRLFGDIDIMVPRGALDSVERALGRAGWIQENRNAYDDRYYRQWMHEIPARRHMQRGTVLDVHHNILPLTARNKPSAHALWKADVRLEGYEDLYVLAPEDMLLHTASHLFCGSEFERGLRDLFDFYRLARQFASTAPEFWTRVVRRAEILDLTRPLSLAVRYANYFFDAEFPADDTSLTVTGLMDAVFTRALLPNHSIARDAWTPVALFLLYVRGHYLRMPFSLLLPHLLYKATLARFHEKKLHDENQKMLKELRAFLGK